MNMISTDERGGQGTGVAERHISNREQMHNSPLCLNCSKDGWIFPALGEQRGFAGVRMGASQGVHGYGASEGPQTVTVIQEQDGELRCHPAPRASLWNDT